MHDQKQREKALNPQQSFIVQAPAGSGKTELLTQRFLSLLSYVNLPEEILAITFTKKSATEMRSRIMNALKKAANSPEPEKDHEKKTWRLAKKVLLKNEAEKWNLLINPNRLKIQTIDAFNVSLTKQLPISSQFGASVELIDNATTLYREAAQELLSHLEENVAWSEDIATLLLHLDNDLNKFETLLVEMLAKRDQWLPHLTTHHDKKALRHQLEKNLTFISDDIVQQLPALISEEDKKELAALLYFSRPKLDLENQKSFWMESATLLLTQEQEWRKMVDKKQGFPAASSSKNTEEKKLFSEKKQRILQLIKKLSNNEKLKNSLSELAVSPPTFYEEGQWKIVQSLQKVLALSAAQLKLLFQQYGKIDYIENAIGALTALGSDETPTDLALVLDYKIQHILMDEFQDTSTSQYRLVEKLTAGWETHDGRTLFLVGDPMQSIYRFREADVGLFIRARKKPIGNILLEPLTLSVNFRSTPTIMKWINTHFQKILPSVENKITGAVPYHPGTTPEDHTTEDSLVAIHPFFNDPDAEASAIIKIIEKEKKENPNNTIAILVRARAHVESIIAALKKTILPYQAVNIDPLASRPIVQDLLSLTQALLSPVDRIAWLSVLRAPWCGLCLADLLILSEDKSIHSIWEALQQESRLEKLSVPGRKKIQLIFPLLERKIKERERYPFRLWIESTWIDLGGPASANHPSDLEDALAFLTLLEQCGNENPLRYLLEHMNQLYATPANLSENPIQIMTIHNAKGLEFDTVILPHLEKKSLADSEQLLLWMEYQKENEDSALILAPIREQSEKSDDIYDYIKRQHAVKADHERGRLLYVASTRAKKKLHYFFTLYTDDTQKIKIASDSLLKKMWDTISPSLEIKEETILISSTKDDKSPRQLKRFATHWENPIREKESETSVFHNPENASFQLPYHPKKYIGTLVHRILHQLDQQGIHWWQKEMETDQIQYIHRHLMQLGMMEKDLSSSGKTVQRAIQLMLQDEKGKWILTSKKESQTEFSLTSIIHHKATLSVIDKTFLDEAGNRWIIDYKTTTPDADVTLKNFLDAEQEKYHAQMQRYADAMRHQDDAPIRLGLYFPLVPAWTELK